MANRALITGITGQDGSYLAEFLLGKGYQVFGLVRRTSTLNFSRIKHIQDRVTLISGDILDQTSLQQALIQARPDEVYNLAAQSDDVVSVGAPEYTAEINGMGPVRLMEAIHQSRVPSRFFQASSSEMFGSAAESPQSEKTPLDPKSPYGFAKVFAHGMIGYYREVHKLFAVSGILFNHESPRRGPAFVTRKITLGLAGILAKKQDKITFGNLDSKRDWGYARDYAEAMWLTLQQKEPEDFVIATGENHSIKEFLEEAFSYAGLDYRKYVESDPRFARAVDIKEMRGDCSKAKRVLGWKPTVSFRELVRLMVDADLEKMGLSRPAR